MSQTFRESDFFLLESRTFYLNRIPIGDVSDVSRPGVRTARGKPFFPFRGPKLLLLLLLLCLCFLKQTKFDSPNCKTLKSKHKVQNRLINFDANSVLVVKKSRAA